MLWNSKFHCLSRGISLYEIPTCLARKVPLSCKEITKCLARQFGMGCKYQQNASSQIVCGDVPLASEGICPDDRILCIKLPWMELINHLVKPMVYFAHLRCTQSLYSKSLGNVLNLSCRNSVKPAFLHDLYECLFTAFFFCHKERNVPTLLYFWDRKINCPKSCIKTTDSVAASIAGTCLRMNPFLCSSLVGNFYFHELVHYPLKHFQ